MKNNKFGFSTMGFAIIVVIIVAIGMIISAPMLVDNYSKESPNPQYADQSNNDSDYNREARDLAEKERYSAEMNSDSSGSGYNDNSSLMNELNNKIINLESSFSQRLSRLEQNSTSSSMVNKLVCSIEGYVDENGNMVAASGSSKDIIGRYNKLVFVCEMK